MKNKTSMLGVGKGVSFLFYFLFLFILFLFLFLLLFLWLFWVLFFKRGLFLLIGKRVCNIGAIARFTSVGEGTSPWGTPTELGKEVEKEAEFHQYVVCQSARKLEKKSTRSRLNP